MKKITLLFLILSYFTGFAQFQPVKIVVLGSSTAYGIGPKDNQNAWVNLLRKYVQDKNISNEVINLAIGGFTTYNILPSENISQIDRPTPSSTNNISKAISYKPDVIIVNIPTNDIANDYSINEILNNFKLLASFCETHNTPIFITTTQPRNYSIDYRIKSKILNDSLYKVFDCKIIDFWNDLADNTGKIIPIFDSGDGVHLNDVAHQLLYQRVILKKIHSSLDILDDVDEKASMNIENYLFIDSFSNIYNFNYNIQYPGNVKILLYNINGSLIKVLFNKYQDVGKYNLEWDYIENKGNKLPKGIYIYKIIINSKYKTFMYTNKLIMIH